jgi:hypothetical protein
MTPVTKMPTLDNANEIRAKIAYNGEVLITYIDHNVQFHEFICEIMGICRFGSNQLFTVKWIDEEGDPCILSSEAEFNEALRLYALNQDNELIIHVFPNVPPQPGMPCQGEDREYFPFLEQIVGAQTTLANLTKNTLATTKVSLQLLNNVHDVN